MYMRAKKRTYEKKHTHTHYHTYIHTLLLNCLIGGSPTNNRSTPAELPKDGKVGIIPLARQMHGRKWPWGATIRWWICIKYVSVWSCEYTRAYIENMIFHVFPLYKEVSYTKDFSLYNVGNTSGIFTKNRWRSDATKSRLSHAYIVFLHGTITIESHARSHACEAIRMALQNT